MYYFTIKTYYILLFQNCFYYYDSPTSYFLSMFIFSCLVFQSILIIPWCLSPVHRNLQTQILDLCTEGWLTGGQQVKLSIWINRTALIKQRRELDGLYQYYIIILFLYMILIMFYV